MKYATIAAAVLAASLLSAGGAAAQQNMAHVHMGHVLTGWNDTPDGMGLLPTALAEAKIALQHVDFALQQPGNLAWMKMHTKHVLHAIDASAIAAGPGLGYGVAKAAKGVADHITFASESDGASDNVKTHAVHVATSADNVVAWAAQAVALAKQIAPEYSPAAAAAKVRRLKTIVEDILNGTDADGDGSVSWIVGEGGLAQAEQHMGFMKAGESM